MKHVNLCPRDFVDDHGHGGISHFREYLLAALDIPESEMDHVESVALWVEDFEVDYSPEYEEKKLINETTDEELPLLLNRINTEEGKQHLEMRLKKM